MSTSIRPARPEDFETVSSVVDSWWARPITAALPRLFFDHFHNTSLIAQDDKHDADGVDGGLVGFLIGFHSPTQHRTAYIHFAGVRPDHRRAGLARRLYTHFAETALAAGCHQLQAITSPSNEASVRFHQRLGFTVTGPVADYNGPDKPMITFQRPLDPGPDSGSGSGSQTVPRSTPC